MDNNSKTKSINDKDTSSNNKSTNNIKGKRISFSQESEISDFNKDNNKIFSPVINKFHIKTFFFNLISIIVIFSQLYNNLYKFENS